MKKLFSSFTKFFSSFILFNLVTVSVFSQTNSYNEYIKNINFVDCRTLEFEVWIEWTGNNLQKFCFAQAGINFNYGGLANGGTLTGAFVPGSADPQLISQQFPNWNINQSSAQIRMYAAIAMRPAAVELPSPPGLRLGTFRIKNTAFFTPGATPNFSWWFGPSGSTTTQTKTAFYIGASLTADDITDPAQHFVERNPPFNLTCILPIELLFFKAEPHGEEVWCSWKTNTEINNDYFNVERSLDGKIFKSIGAVKGFGEGVCSSPRDYSLIDNDACVDVRYYRLKQTDINGDFAYSQTIPLDCRRNSGIDIWPNPVLESFTYRFYCSRNADLETSIIDNTGRIVNSEKIEGIKGMNQLTKTIDELAAGSYFLKIKVMEGEDIILNRLFLKN